MAKIANAIGTDDPFFAEGEWFYSPDYPEDSSAEPEDLLEDWDEVYQVSAAKDVVTRFGFRFGGENYWFKTKAEADEALSAFVAADDEE